MATTRQWHPTACILCECNCGLEVELGGEDGRHLVLFRGDKRHPSSKGYACEKAHRLDHYQNGRDRLTTPLRRRADGSFVADAGGGKTQYRAVSLHRNMADKEAHEKMGFHEGWGTVAKQLEEFAQHLAANA